MTDRPILFSAPMIRALIDGRKSQTRRLTWRECRCCFGGGQVWAGQCGLCNGSGDTPTIWQKVRPGDQLWVRETHWRLGRWVKNGLTKTGRQRWRFRPYGESVLFDDPLYDSDMVRGADQPARYWKRPSIFLPRKFSRLTLEVTETKLERLQEISYEDMRDEGTVCPIHGTIRHVSCSGLRRGWCELWNTPHKPGNRWEDNPEVCAISFTVHKANIDRLEQAA